MTFLDPIVPGRLRRFLAALCIAALPFGGPASAAETLRGVALVIGQSEYEHLSPLPNPENDADAIDELLSDLGFEVDLVTNADLKKLTRSFERFIEDAEDADVALLYYSGHGIEGGGENFLLPVDADNSALENAGERLVPLSKIVAQLQATVPVTIVLLDACRTNPFPAGATMTVSAGAAPVPMAQTGLAAPDATRGAASLQARDAAAADSLGAVLGFAAAPGQPALDGDPGGNSPYAAALIKHLSAGGYAFADVMTMVTEEVYLRTDARQTPWTNTSLRRLLYFGETAEDADGDEAAIRGERRKLLLTLASVPDAERRQVVSVANERGVPMDALFAMLNAIGAEAPDDPDQLSRLLNDQAARLQTLLAERRTLDSADPEIARLAALANEAVEEGALETAIGFHQRAKARVTELESTLADAEADLKARRIEHGAVFAASAATYALAYDHERAAADYASAFEQVERWDDALALRYKLAEARALSDLGFFHGNDDATARSVEAFKAAARLAPSDTNPAGWADAQSGLAIALWTRGERQTESAGLEEARAVLRAAIDSPALAPLPDKRATLNADLALVLMTLGMRELGTDRLVEAEKAALDAMQVKTKEAAPYEWARLQNHLGSILFVQGLRQQSLEPLQRAAVALRAAQEVWSAEETPIDWANSQNNLGLVIGEIGTREPGQERLLEAVELLKSALAVRTRDVAPLHWAESMTNLASTYHQLGVRDSQTTKWFEESAAALGSALQEITRKRDPLKWAAVEDNLGLAIANIADRTADPRKMQEAIVAYTLALSERTRERVPLDWAATMSNLANAHYRIGDFTHNPERMREAVAIYEAVLEVRTRDRDAVGWARSQNNLANVLATLGGYEEGVEQHRKSVEHYNLALTALDPASNGIGFADTNYNLSLVYLAIGRKTGEQADYDAARAALKLCVDIYHGAGITEYDSFFTDIETAIQIGELEAQVAGKLKALQQEQPAQE